MNVSRREFMGKMGAVGTGAAMLSFPVHELWAASKERPNFLWIMAEDISIDLGCYGVKEVQTPILDRMADEGLLFTNAYCTAPVCSPSRSAMITGMYQTTLGAHLHRSQRINGAVSGDEPYFDSYYLPQGIAPFTEHLRKAGYFTANVRNAATGASGTGKEDFNFQLSQKAFDGDDWSQRQPGQPFFAQLTFKETHRGPHWQDIPHQVPNRVDPLTVELPPYIPDTMEARQDWATYLDSIQWCDALVGSVLKRLEEENLAKNTIIFFIGDNGRCQVRGKQWLYDAGIKIPLIVRWPGKLKSARRDDLVSTIDIPYTILRLAGVNPPEYMQGIDFLSPKAKKRDYVFAARDRCDETVDVIRCVRDKRYKYIRNYTPHLAYMQPNQYKDTSYPIRNILRALDAEGKLEPAQKPFMAERKPMEELYDTQTDPHEVVNLAHMPEYQDILVKMRRAHEKWMIETADLGLIPEPELEDLGRQFGSKYRIFKEKDCKSFIENVLTVIQSGEKGISELGILLATLSDDDASVRYWAAIWLGNLGHESAPAKEAILTATKDASASVRIAAARALSQMDEDALAVPLFLQELENANHAARHYAALELESMANKAKRFLDQEHYDGVNRVMQRIFSR